MKLLKSIISVLILTISIPAFSWLSNFVGVKVIIKGYDQKEIEAEDALQAKLFIPRDAVPLNYKMVTGKVVVLPVDVQKFSQIRTIPTASFRKLKNQGTLTFANLQKGISDSRK